MTSVRRQLEALADDCNAKCVESSWMGSDTVTPNFRLLYSSVESFEKGNGIVILGMNPAGPPSHATPQDHTRSFREPRYSAYLDDRWGSSGRGQHGLQRAVQGIAMILTGATPSRTMLRITNTMLTPEKRIGTEATELLRKAPSGNIIPYRASKLECIRLRLRKHGVSIGWQLLCSARPKPSVIVTLANGVTGERWKRIVWGTILENSQQPLKADYCKRIYTKRTYRDVKLRQGPLKGALVIGLPAVVYDKVKENGVTKPMFEVLAKRLRHHKLL